MTPIPSTHGIRVAEFDARVAADFRRAMAQFASGVVIVTAVTAAHEPVGMTCQSFSSLSLDPPMVLFAPSRTSTTFPRLREVGSVCVNVLTHKQDALSSQFAVSGGDKWKGVRWSPGRNAAPRVAGAAMWCEGDIEMVHPAGDHFVAIVSVTSLATTADLQPPLIFHDGRYAGLQAAHFARLTDDR
jgi:3-hydroxy-9,10-secoandrosta-1,3,5(10)-triene-9,17-dione monooxygenase reductase component